jgi:hypothetical protein
VSLPTSNFRVRPGLVVRLLLVIILFPVAVYGVLLVLQTYSAWQAARTLRRLDALRLGDPADEFDRAVRACRWDGDTHLLVPMTYRLDWYGPLWNHVAPRAANRISDLLNLLQLRYWRLTASAKIENRQISGLSVGLVVFNREEALGGGWRLVSHVPEVYLRRTPNKNVATFVRQFSITALTVVGEGYDVVTTTQSSSEDLNARNINSACLLPFRRCRTPLELLPRVEPLLEKQNLAGR